MLHSKNPLLGNCTQRMYCQTVRMGQEGSNWSVKDWKNVIYSDESMFKTFPFAHSEDPASETQKVFLGPASETRKVFLTAYNDSCEKNTLEVKVCVCVCVCVWGGGLSRDGSRGLTT